MKDDNINHHKENKNTKSRKSTLLSFSYIYPLSPSFPATLPRSFLSLIPNPLLWSFFFLSLRFNKEILGEMAAKEPVFNAPRSLPATPAGASQQQHSPWHSPVPYLFGGLAAMLGLIAFALLILACSYWKLSGYLEDGQNEGGERDLEAGEDGKDGDGEKKPVAFEEKILVIMAGEMKPTYLATPMSGRSSSFGDNNNNNDKNSSNKSCSCSSSEKDEKLDVEMAKQEGQSGSMDGNDSSSVDQQNH